MSYGYGFNCSCACVQIEPFVGSVFPKLDLYLDTHAGAKDLKRIEDKRRSRHFATTQDYLLCMVFPQYRHACKSFYKEDGKDLKSSVNAEEIERMEEAILAYLTA
jgi:hypothetical protein